MFSHWTLVTIAAGALAGFVGAEVLPFVLELLK